MQGNAFLKLAVFLFLWYAFNVAYNVYNKTILTVFPFPWTAACLQLGIGLLYILPVWTLGIRPAPVLTQEDIKKLSPVAALHTIGHVATVLALGGGSVGFVHIVKAAEPLFSTVLSALILHQFQPFIVNLSLLPVVIGVCVASVSELSFNWPTLVNALLSNTFFSLRAIYSKKTLTQDSKESKNLDAANLYAVLTLLSFIGLVPYAIAMEGPELRNGYLKAIETLGSATFFKQNMLCGLSYYLYNEVAYLVLENVIPVTHAVANTIKRIVILVAGVVAFGTVVTMQGLVGSAIAIGGVFLYSILLSKYKKSA
jgi:solute carrier family 35 protein E1